LSRRSSVFIFLQRLHLPLCGLPHRLHLLQTQVGDGTACLGGAALDVAEAGGEALGHAAQGILGVYFQVPGDIDEGLTLSAH